MLAIRLDAETEARLEALAGECYAVVKKEFDRLLPLSARRPQAAVQY